MIKKIQQRSSLSLAPASKELDGVEAQRGEVLNQVSEARRSFDAADKRRQAAVEDWTRAQQATGRARSTREELRLRLAEVLDKAAAARRELDLVEADGRTASEACSASRAQLLRLQTQREALALARDELLPASLQPSAAAEAIVEAGAGASGSAPRPVLLAAVPSEVGELARLEQEALEQQLKDIAANTAASDREREAFESECQTWVEEAEQLRQELSAIEEARRVADEALQAARHEASERRNLRRRLCEQLEALRSTRDRLQEENERMATDVDRHRDFVENMRSMTWREIEDAHGAVVLAAQGMQRAKEHHEHRKLELANLAAAHAHQIARGGAGARLLRLRTPPVDPNRTDWCPATAQGPGPLPAPHRPAAPLPRAAGPAQAVTACPPFSARTPRSDLRDMGQLILGTARA